jgi:DNA-binding NarL/FixJ family response regulator
MRRRGDARRAIEEAIERFERLPAPLWTARARDELARTGMRRRNGYDLSPTEERAADLAARGLTNREIAAELFLTPKSIEDVLRRVYQALGVRNRTELAALRGSHTRS